MTGPNTKSLAQLIEVSEMLSHDLLLEPGTASEPVAQRLAEALQHARMLHQVLSEAVRLARSGVTSSPAVVAQAAVTPSTPTRH